MKHIRRRFLYELPADVIKKNPAFTEFDINSNEKIPKGMAGFSITDAGFALISFQVQHNKTFYTIPEPDPVCLYFNNAQIHSRLINNEISKLIDSVSYKGEVLPTGKIAHTMYSFFHHSSSYAIFLFTAIETFLNKSLPKNFQYHNRKGDLLSVDEIQRNVPFIEKVKKVLPAITGRKFVDDFPSKFESLLNLKKLRDEMVHVKKKDEALPSYSEMLTVALNFKYEYVLLNARDFINYYQPGAIEECGCGEDF